MGNDFTYVYIYTHMHTHTKIVTFEKNMKFIYQKNYNIYLE